MADDSVQSGRLRAQIRGNVQGVGFRANTQREAARLNLTGWVRNAWDGTVEVVAEGPRANLDRFVAYLHRGPSGAVVEQVDISYEEATGEFRGFHIRY